MVQAAADPVIPGHLRAAEDPPAAHPALLRVVLAAAEVLDAPLAAEGAALEAAEVSAAVQELVEAVAAVLAEAEALAAAAAVAEEASAAVAAADGADIGMKKYHCRKLCSGIFVGV